MNNTTYCKEHYEALQLLTDKKLIKSYDKNFSKSLLQSKDWTERQAHAIDQLLSKYQIQLSENGIDYIAVNHSLKNKNFSEQKPDLLLAELKDKIYLTVNLNDQNKFWFTVNLIKELPGRKYDSKTKQWTVPVTQTIIKSLQDIKFTFDENLNNYIDQINHPEFKKLENEKYNLQNIRDKIGIPQAYGYQVEGIIACEKFNGRILNADEMGTGKSLQAIGYLQLHPENRPAIIICPATLKINWQREIKNLTGENSYIINGRNIDDNLQNEKLIIINYDIVVDHYENLKNLNPKVIIIDECHKIKSSSTIRTKVIKKLCKGVPHIIGLTGTPIMNKPIEIFNIANILQPEIFDSYYRFGQKYCAPANNGFGVTYDGASHVEELHALLTENVMIRRKKEDVLKDLPEKRTDLILFDLEPSIRKKYDSAERDIVSFITDTKGEEAGTRAMMAEALIKFNELKQITIEGKIKSCITWIEDFLESGEKLVVFTTHKKTVELLLGHFKDIAVKVDGSCSQEQRQESIDKFQNNPDIKLFVGNLQAASEGITLTAASNLAFIELGWNPALHNQASNRIHRIGQKNGCLIYYLIARGTIEEDLAIMIDRKQLITDAIIDGVVTEDGNLLTHLINKYREEKAS